MNIKLIVLDLDDTLLHSDKSISEYTLTVLIQMKQKGIKLAVATARSEKAASRYIQAVKPDAVISNGGSLVRYGNDILYKCMLPAEVSNQITNECLHRKEVTAITSETDTGYYVTFDEPASSPDYAHAIAHDYTVPISEDTYKIVVEISDHNVAAEIESKFPQCRMLAFANENWYRFAHKDSSKINAIKELAKFLNIELTQIAAFGDDYNDIDMIKECGVGVSMGNAIDEIKAVANYVCDTNNNDGIAKWLDKYELLI